MSKAFNMEGNNLRPEILCCAQDDNPWVKHSIWKETTYDLRSFAVLRMTTHGRAFNMEGNNLRQNKIDLLIHSLLGGMNMPFWSL